MSVGGGGLAPLIAEIANEFDRRHWRDPGGEVLRAAEAFGNGGPAAAADAVSTRFIAINGVDRATVAAALASIALPQTGSSAVEAPSAARRSNHDRQWTTGASLLATLRIVAATTIAIVGTELLLIAPEISKWDWLLAHPNRFAIQGLGILTLLLVAAGLLFARWGAIIAAGVALVALLAVLGGLPSPQVVPSIQT
jgi:hypothetical protein